MDLDAMIAELRELRRSARALMSRVDDEWFAREDPHGAMRSAKWHMGHAAAQLWSGLVGRIVDERHAPAHAFELCWSDYANARERAALARHSRAAVVELAERMDTLLEDVAARGTQAFDGSLPRLAELLEHEAHHLEAAQCALKSHARDAEAAPLMNAFSSRPRAKATVNDVLWNQVRERTFRCGGGETARGAAQRELVRVHLAPFAMANRLVNCGEYLHFVREGGYDDDRVWSPAGARARERGGWTMPANWVMRDGRPYVHTLRGLEGLRPEDPVTHVSMFEASAYARFVGARLPTEHEWESEASRQRLAGKLEPEAAGYEPAPARLQEREYSGLLGAAWQWTTSAFRVPGPIDAEELVGGEGDEGGMTVRGGSCLTPRARLSATLRLGLAPHRREWVTGIRLARDVGDRADSGVALPARAVTRGG